MKRPRGTPSAFSATLRPPVNRAAKWRLDTNAGSQNGLRPRPVRKNPMPL